VYFPNEDQIVQMWSLNVDLVTYPLYVNRLGTKLLYLC